MKRRASTCRPAWVLAGLLLLLAACGGGSGPPSAQQNPSPSPMLQVLPGDSSVVPPYSDAGGDAGDSASGDGGPGLGRLRNALVRVELADGRVAGEAQVDAVRGVVHVRLSNYAGPVRFTARARADGSTTYYDEAAARFVPYPPGSELNAVVPRFDKNVGITILTEAAWRYLVTRHGADGWKDPARVSEANAVVRDDFNRFVPPEFRVADITRLPYLLGDDTPDGGIADTPNGRYGVVLSGLGVAAGLFRPADPAPVLRLAAQMPLDYCDGVLDGTCNGVPVAGDPADAAYAVAQLPAQLETGVQRIAERYLATAPGITTQPQDASRIDGEPAGFSVVATGTQPLAYQWRRNGAPIAGATAAAYAFTATLADNGATFSVVVSNAAGAVTSRAALLTVTAPAAPPTILQQPRSVTVSEGSGATFSVLAAGGAPLSYQWRRDGVPVAGATGASYTTPATSLADTGASFTVSVGNAAGGIASDAAILTVHRQDPICGNAAGGGWCWRSPLPQGNSLYGLAYASASTAVAVGDNGTILRTTDGGATWSANWRRDNGLLDADFADATTGIAVGVQGAIRRTTDGGVTWTSVVSGTGNALYRVRFVTPAVVVAVGQNHTVLRSTDSGATWNSVAGAGTLSLAGLAFADANTGVAVGETGTLERTTDGGATWAAVQSGTTAGLAAVRFNAGGTGVAVGAGGVILRTLDAGATWTRVPGPGTTTLDDVSFADAATGVAVGRRTVLRTTDAGVTWSPVDAPALDLTKVRFANATDGIAVGTHGEMLRTLDAGATWSAVSRGPVSGFLDVAFIDANTGAAVGDAGTIARTTDGGGTWTPVPSGRAGALHGVAFAGGTGIVVGAGGTMLRSMDGGATWMPLAQVSAQDLFDATFIDPATAIAVGDAGTILRSLDAGATWTPVPNTAGRQLLDVKFLGSAIGIAVGTDGTILRTTDRGASWNVVASGTTSHLFGVAFAGGSSTVVAVGSGLATLRSTDGGLNWAPVATGIPAALLAVHFADTANGFAVGQFGWALRTNNGGLSWTVVNGAMLDDLNGVHALGAATAVAVGRFGAIVRTTTGGQ
jgi:photosystem II stability/assembly factor-like uncharacterized protein